MPETIVISTLNASSELGKLMSNAMLAQRISSINSITSLTEKFEECSVDDVKAIVGSDSRIGSQFLNPSPGFGGSCFEKDILSLVHILYENGELLSAQYWQAVLDMNTHQKLRLAQMISKDLKDKKKVCIFGFSFKKNTSDTRLSQSAFIINYLSQNFKVSVHDP